MFGEITFAALSVESRAEEESGGINIWLTTSVTTP